MNDTEILDVVLAALDINATADWSSGDPAAEFQQLAEDVRRSATWQTEKR